MGFRPHTSQGDSPTTEIYFQNFSCHPLEPSQLSRAFSALPSSLVVVKWFLLSVLRYKALLQLMFSWLLRMLSLQLNYL